MNDLLLQEGKEIVGWFFGKARQWSHSEKLSKYYTERAMIVQRLVDTIEEYQTIKEKS